MSRTWVPLSIRSPIEYGGSASQYFWEYSNNPGAYYDPSLGTYDLALPNCTTYAYGRVQMNGDPKPISGWHNADAWHSNLINGWTAVQFVGNSDLVRPGDIIEITGSGNHVAVIEEVYDVRYWRVTESYYTADNGGVSGYRSPAVWGSTKQSVNDYGIANYPYRYWHSRTWDCRTTSSPDTYPDYILLNPNSHEESTRFTFLGFKKRSLRRRRMLYV